MEKDFFCQNRQKLLTFLDDDSIVVLFSGKAPHKTADKYYTFVPNKNFYYMTGIDQENTVFVAYKSKGMSGEMLFIERRDLLAEKWVGHKLESMDAAEISGIENVRYIDEFGATFNSLLQNHGYINLYLDLERREWDWPMTEVQRWAKEIREKYPFLTIKNVYHTISDFRTIKTAAEIEKIKEAIRITCNGIKAMMENVKPGMMEYQLEAWYDFVLKSSGIKDMHTIAASGINATVLHYDANNCRIKDGDLVLVDQVAAFEHYYADISRTFPASGKFTDRQKQVYGVVLEAQLAVIDFIRPGISFHELNEFAKKVLADGCKKIGLIKNDDEISQYYYHRISHHLGLDIHDVGSYDGPLKQGMVLTVEPGIYIAQEKMGIRIEDDVLVTENGCEILSGDFMKGIDEIEEFMARRGQV